MIYYYFKNSLYMYYKIPYYNTLLRHYLLDIIVNIIRFDSKLRKRYVFLQMLVFKYILTIALDLNQFS